jgi:hypothetical protein
VCSQKFEIWPIFPVDRENGILVDACRQTVFGTEDSSVIQSGGQLSYAV